MKIILEGIKPVSTNNMYKAVSRTMRGKRVAVTISTPELVNYKKEIKQALANGLRNFKDFDPEGRYQLAIEVSYPKKEFFTLKGKLKQRDASNCIKALEDGIYEAIGVNDKQNLQVHIGKYYNNDDKHLIFIEILADNRTDSELCRGIEYYKSIANK